MTGPRRWKLAAVALALGLASPAAQAARRVGSEAHGFSFDLPTDFRDLGAGASAPRTLLSFVRGAPGQGLYAILRCEAMGGEIGRGPLDHEAAERSARESARGSKVELSRFAYGTVRWKSYDLDTMITEALDPSGQKLVLMATQVPVAGQAIQVSLVGPFPEQGRMMTELQSVMSTFEAATNWDHPVKPRTSRDELLSYRIGQLIGIACGIVAAFAFWRVWRRRGQVAKK